MKPNLKPTIVLKWRYASGGEYEFVHHDSTVVGTLYKLKIDEPQIVEVSMWFDGHRLVHWKKETS